MSKYTTLPVVGGFADAALQGLNERRLRLTEPTNVDPLSRKRR